MGEHPVTPSRLYIARECLVSAVINALMSTVAFVVVFGLGRAAPIVMARSFAADFAIQGGMVAFAATAIPGLLARRAAAQGRIDPRSVGALSASDLLRRTLGAAVLAAVASAAAWSAGLAVFSVTAVFVFAGAACKAGYGAALAVCCTCSVLQPQRRLSAL